MLRSSCFQFKIQKKCRMAHVSASLAATARQLKNRLPFMWARWWWWSRSQDKGSRPQGYVLIWAAVKGLLSYDSALTPRVFASSAVFFFQVYFFISVLFYQFYALFMWISVDWYLLGYFRPIRNNYVVFFVKYTFCCNVVCCQFYPLFMLISELVFFRLLYTNEDERT